MKKNKKLDIQAGLPKGHIIPLAAVRIILTLMIRVKIFPDNMII
jgi:hypothetical protein